MRFSLKLLLAVFILLAAGIAWFVTHREAEMGVEVRVPKPVALDDYYEVPNTLLEIRSRWQVREHERAFENSNDRLLDKRIAEIRNSVTWFFPGSSQQLVDERSDELVQIARTCLATNPGFVEAVRASLILHLCGQSDGFESINSRFLEQRPEDQKDLGEFLYRFPDEAIASDSELLALLTTAAAVKESSLYWQASHLLYNANIDRLPLTQLKRDQLNVAGQMHDSIVWLMDHQPDLETAEAVEQYLSKSTSFDLGFILARLSDHKVPELARLGRRAEKLMIERLSVVAKDEPDQSASIHRQLDAWRKLGHYCSDVSVVFFRSVLEHVEHGFSDSKNERVAIACRALKRIGHVADAERIVKAYIKSSAESATFYDNRIILFDVAEEALGRRQVVGICKTQLDSGYDQAAIKKLGQLFEGTSDERIVELIVKVGLTEKQEAAPALGFETLKSISRIGSKRLSEYWKLLRPAHVSEDSIFYRHWANHNTTRQQLIDWINTELKPTNKLTVAQVLANPKYGDGNHWIWHDVMYDALEKDENATLPIETDQEFAMIALAHSGVGNLAYDDRYPLEGGVDVMAGKIADIESQEFVVTSYGYDRETGTIDNAFVVNQRLYKFSHSEGFNGSDDRYSTQAATEILNAVAIRQRLLGRFFCYGNEWGVTLVMYLTPDQARELEDKFGIVPKPGFEYYLDH